MSKYKIDNLVIYDGLVARIERISTIGGTDRTLLSLVSVEDEEMTCSAPADECEDYTTEASEDLDQNTRLARARFESNAIAAMVDNITDKNFRDGNH